LRSRLFTCERHRVLGDEEALGDLVRAQVLVQEEQHLHLARAELARDRLRHARIEAAAVADAVEEPPGDLARQRGLPVRDAGQELRDPLGGSVFSR
jgi:hypothetical protein